MDEHGLQAVIWQLGRYRRDVEEAQRELQTWIKVCIFEGCDSVQIAQALGCEPGTVRKMRAWKERRR